MSKTLGSLTVGAKIEVPVLSAYQSRFWLCQDRHTVFSEFFQLPPKWGALIVLACRYKFKPARSTHIYLNLS